MIGSNTQRGMGIRSLYGSGTPFEKLLSGGAVTRVQDLPSVPRGACTAVQWPTEETFGVIVQELTQGTPIRCTGPAPLSASRRNLRGSKGPARCPSLAARCRAGTFRLRTPCSADGHFRPEPSCKAVSAGAAVSRATTAAHLDPVGLGKLEQRIVAAGPFDHPAGPCELNANGAVGLCFRFSLEGVCSCWCAKGSEKASYLMSSSGTRPFCEVTADCCHHGLPDRRRRIRSCWPCRTDCISSTEICGHRHCKSTPRVLFSAGLAVGYEHLHIRAVSAYAASRCSYMA